jgi:hypothetical protein
MKDVPHQDTKQDGHFEEKAALVNIEIPYLTRQQKQYVRMLMKGAEWLACAAHPMQIEFGTSFQNAEIYFLCPLTVLLHVKATRAR